MELLANATTGLAFISFLTIVAGRRENTLLCLTGAWYYLKIALCCWPAGLIVLGYSYLSQVLHYGNPVETMLAPLLEPAGRPWLSSLLAWLAGGAAMLAAILSLPRRDTAFTPAIKIPIIAAALAALSFYASLCLINWPFAGLPPDLSMERAAMAIMRHALHQYIMCFCPAGALALLMTLFKVAGIPAEFIKTAMRWPAIWAAAGAVPTLLQSWGIILGLGLGGRLQGSLAQGLWQPTLGIICLTMAVFIWVIVIWKPLKWPKLGAAAFGLLLLKATIPVFAALLR